MWEALLRYTVGFASLGPDAGVARGDGNKVLTTALDARKSQDG
jgi:hypothetical protein